MREMPRVADESLNRWALGTRWGMERQPEMAAFSQWSRRYVTAGSEAGRKAMLDEGVALAEQRRAALEKLIRVEPKEALAAAVPVMLRALLPPEVLGLLEERVSGKGDFQVLGALPRENARPGFQPTQHRVVIGGRRFEAFVFGDRAGQRTAFAVSMHGIAIDHALALSDSPIRLLEPGEAPNPAKPVLDTRCPISGKEASADGPVAESGEATYRLCGPAHLAPVEQKVKAAEGGGEKEAAYQNLGNKRLLLMLVDFSDLVGGPASHADATNRMAQIAAFFKASSFDQMSFTNLSVTPVLRMPRTASYYGSASGGDNDLLADARTAAASAGFATAGFEYDIVAFEDVGYNWGGLGFVGAKGTWVQGSFSAGVAAHELGHNVGLRHAGSWASSTIIGSGTFTEYGNDFDVMGKASSFPAGHYSGNFKYVAGWLPNAYIHTVSTSGTYRIYAMDSGSNLDPARRYSARIPVSMSVAGLVVDYWLDYRQQFISYPALVNGAVLQWGDDAGTRYASRLLDTTPVTLGVKSDAPIRVGQTFTDSAHNLTISTLANGGSGADAYLDIQISISNAPPVSLAESLDAPALVWSTGGTASWSGQSAIAHDGVDAARSGAIGNSQDSWVETTVTGPGTLTFWWKVSSESGFDYLGFATNGATQSGSISGEVDWQQRTFTIAAGPQTLRWHYSKDGSAIGGQDRGWLDQVSFSSVSIPPLITDQPVSRTVVAGSSALLSVTASGSGPLSYQWRKSGTNIAGAILPSLAFTNVQAADAGTYSVLVSNPFGSAPSSNAVLSVVAALSIPVAVDTTNLVWTTGGNANWLAQTVTTHDGVDAAQSGSISHGQESWLETTLTGPGTLTFWWKVSSESGFDYLSFAINGATQSGGISGEVDWQQRSFTIPAGAQTLRWRYSKDGSVVARQDLGWVDQVVFIPEPPVPPSIVTQPASVTVLAGSTATFNVTANGSAPLNYQWRKAGTPLPGATNVAHTIAAAVPADAGAYSVTVTNPQGSVTSSNASLTVLAALTLGEAVDATNLTWTMGGSAGWFAQTVTTQDGSDAARSGAISHSQESWLETTVAGPGTLSFWWKVSSESGYDYLRFALNGVTQSGGISGEVDWQQRSFTIPAGAQTLRWRYSKDGSVNAGQDSAWLDQVMFGGTNLPPVITSQPTPQTVLAGGTASFSVTATGTAPLAYQWRFNGTNLAGATNTSHAIVNAQTSHAGSYSVVVSNPYGSVTSSNAVLTVQSLAPLQFAAANYTVSESVTNVSLTVVRTNGAGAASVGFFTANGTALAGQDYASVSNRLDFAAGETIKTVNIPILDDAVVEPNESFTVTLANPIGTSLGTPATATVTLFDCAPPVIMTHPLSRTIGVGSNVTFTVVASNAVQAVSHTDSGGVPEDRFVLDGGATAGVVSITYDFYGVPDTLHVYYQGVRIFDSGLTNGARMVAIPYGPGAATAVEIVINEGNGLSGTAWDYQATLTPAQTLVTYQWQFNQVNVPGATNSSLSLANLQLTNGGDYRVIVANHCGAVTSLVATLTVTNPIIAPVQFAAANYTVSESVTNVALTVVRTNGTGAASVGFFTANGTALAGQDYVAVSGQLNFAVGETSKTVNIPILGDLVVEPNESFTVTLSNPTGGAALGTPSTATVTITDDDSGLTAVHSSVGYIVGGTASIHVRIDYPGTLTSLGYEVVLPTGWSYASDTSTAGVKPAPNEQGIIGLAWTAIPASPVEFDLLLNVPAGTTGEKTLSAQASIRQGGPEIRADAMPNPLRLNLYIPYHSADTSQNWRFNLTELTRVISLYNYRTNSIRTGEFHAETGTEDGYAAAPGAQTGRRHSADTSGNWAFSLTELTRVISLYNYRENSIRTGDYHPQTGTEDGYAPGPAVVGQSLGAAGASGGGPGRLVPAAVETAALSSASQVYVPGQTLTVALQVAYEGTLTAYGWELDLPTGWSYVSDTSTAGVKPDVSQQGILEWAWTGSFPASPTAFNVMLQVPANASGNRSLAARAILRDPLRTLAATALTLSDVAPVLLAITTQPRDQTVVVGANVTFSVSATGQPPFTYQWRKDGTNLIGSVSSSLALNNVALNQSGLYSVAVTDAAGTMSSSPARLIVTTSLFQTPAPQTTAAIRSQGFGLSLLLETGRAFRVQATTDLFNPMWTDVTNFVSTGAALQFIDAAATNQTRRFYRVVSP